MAQMKHLVLLSQGVDAWNEWREKNPQIKPDLSWAHLGANLSRAHIGANLSRTILCKLNLSRPKLSRPNLNLANVGANLIRGVPNLSRANLSGANLSGANLSGANLSGANLSRANLWRTQALNTNFNKALLTGVCIEDWNINSDTQLDGVLCDYVYLRRSHQERRPAIGNFAPGEFTKLVQKVLETIDLIFLNGIDWQAFFASFQKLQVEAENTELSIQAIEKKSTGAFVIRVNVPPDANKAEIEKLLKREYGLQLKAVEEKYRYQLKAKDEQIEFFRQQSTDMMEIVKLMASRPIDVKAIAISESESMSEASKYNMSGSNIANVTDSYVNLGTQNISQNNYEAEKQNLADAAVEIQQLLQQLEQTYPTNTLVEKATVAEEAIKQIENNPTLKQRIVAALKTFTIEVFKEAVDNPIVNIMVPTLESWQKGE